MNNCTCILLADDDKDDVELFQAAVRECAPELSVFTAINGEMLIQLLDRVSSPDLIILDLNMPLLNGFECLIRLRQIKNLRRVPIMIYSTSASPQDINHCFINGANYYIVKPESYTALKKFVGDLAGGAYQCIY